MNMRYVLHVLLACLAGGLLAACAGDPATPEQILGLVDAFDRAGYFELADDYAVADLTDLGSASTSITLGNIRKSVYHSYGDLTAPGELYEVEPAIEEIINTAQLKN
jgi:hypothetical protein